MSFSHGIEVTKRLEEQEKERIANFGLKSSERREIDEPAFRDYKNKALEYRTEYHRDRDRIVWSSAFKRMQHKTQVFPHYVADHYRRRLTHSIEVSQIATTLARGLQLNEIATEAMALAHDLGHAPFGHVGEEALNKVTMDQIPNYKDVVINPYEFNVPVFGFDHCIQGIECVSRLESSYWQGGKGYAGLNLTYDVREGILKHIKNYDELTCKKDNEYPEKPFSSLKGVIKLEEYKIFKGDYGSLEAQCVWIADKLAYLLSDLQDGLRCHVFKIEELLETPFFKAVWLAFDGYRDDAQKPTIRCMDDFFLYLQNYIFPAIILNVFENTLKSIRNQRIESLEGVKSCSSRLVMCSPDLWEKWGKFHKHFMENKFYHHESVEACDYKAKKIVKDLFLAYLQEEKLIRKEYRNYLENVYGKKVDSSYMKLITAKSYVAGMTDAYALEQHSRLFMSSVKATIF